MRNTGYKPARPLQAAGSSSFLLRSIFTSTILFRLQTHIYQFRFLPGFMGELLCFGSLKCSFQAKCICVQFKPICCSCMVFKLNWGLVPPGCFEFSVYVDRWEVLNPQPFFWQISPYLWSGFHEFGKSMGFVVYLAVSLHSQLSVQPEVTFCNQ